MTARVETGRGKKKKEKENPIFKDHVDPTDQLYYAPSVHE